MVKRRKYNNTHPAIVIMVFMIALAIMWCTHMAASKLLELVVTSF